MKLICEVLEGLQSITEEKAGKKHLWLEGTFLQGNIKNRNGRIYNADMLESEVNRYNESHIKTNRAWGELGHPQGPTINLDRICIKHESVHRDGDNFIGRSKVLTELPMGQIVEGLINAGGSLGVSSRGMGSLKMEEGVAHVQNDFRLATLADVVTDPSAHDAFVQGIFENVNWIFDSVSGTYSQQPVDRLAESMKKMPAKTINENKVKLFEQFIWSLSNRKLP